MKKLFQNSKIIKFNFKIKSHSVLNNKSESHQKTQSGNIPGQKIIDFLNKITNINDFECFAINF